MSKAKELYLQIIEGTLSYIEGLQASKKSHPLPSKPLPLPPQKKEIKKAPSPILTSTCQKSSFSSHLQTQKETFKTSVKSPSLTPLSPVTSSSSSQNMRAIFKEMLPDFYLYEKPLTDKKAKRIKEAFKQTFETPSIPILSSGKIHHGFLNNIAKALTILFAPSKVMDLTEIEKEKKWDLFLASPKLKLILAPDTLIFSSKQLLSFYRENSHQKTHFLHQTPLFLLPDLSLYLKNPPLKRLLWDKLCQTLISL